VQRVVRDVEREAAIAKRRQDELDVRHRGRSARAAVLEHAPSPSVTEHHGPGVHRLRANGGLPVIAPGRLLDLSEDRLDQAVEQIVLVANVAIQRHGVDAELLAQLAHAERLDAAAVGELDRDEEDALPAERRPAPDGRVFADHHLTSVRGCDMFTA
jgi:hypothetical protein